jgi:S-adenosylmethionine hydrolase
MIDRIALVTDFGGSGPYVGQLRLILSALLPRIPVVELISDLVPFRPDLAAYVLPALARDMPARTLYLCVVDPGVGGDRAAIAVLADGNWYVGPDNGLLALVARRAKEVRALRVSWRPERLSPSFHGRDLFAPIAALLCDGTVPQSEEVDCSFVVGGGWPNELPRLVYADAYGNLMTGLRASSLNRGAVVRAGGRALGFARTFCEVPPGEAFWYENAFGLVELAVNQGRADRALGLRPGDPIQVPERIP